MLAAEVRLTKLLRLLYVSVQTRYSSTAMPFSTSSARASSVGGTVMPSRGGGDDGGQRTALMIYGPKEDGTYVIEFKTAAGEALAVSTPRSEAGVIRHLQERMPYACSCRRCEADQGGAPVRHAQTVR
jgi:hypothetical protein